MPEINVDSSGGIVSKLQWTIITALALALCAEVMSIAFVAGAVFQPIARAAPMTVVNSPTNGSTFRAGDSVVIQALSTDPNGISQVDILIDGAVVQSYSLPQPQAAFAVFHTWQPDAGSHNITVRAFGRDRQLTNSTGVSILALATSTPTATLTPADTATPVIAPIAATATLTTIPTATPTIATATATLASAAACYANSAFVADVTVPDGTLLAPGQGFNKIWRLANTGTCAWGYGYNLVFVGGESMGAPLVVAAPPTTAGATADILVPMAASLTPGLHAGYWRLRTPGGQFVGGIYYVAINVLGSIPIPQPQPQPTCYGTPYLSYFAASATTITSGSSTTLSWGLVGNANAAYVDNGIGGVMTPGSVEVRPTSNTTYTLTGYCGSNSTSAQLTIYVVSPTATPVPNTATSTSTATLTPTATGTGTITVTPTVTSTLTLTPTPTPTGTLTVTSTVTGTISGTTGSSMSAGRSQSAPTATQTPALTPTPPATPTPSATPVSTQKPTLTAVPPATLAPTLTPSPAATTAPTLAPSATSAPTQTPLQPTPKPTLTPVPPPTAIPPTVPPPTAVPPTTAPSLPTVTPTPTRT